MPGSIKEHDTRSTRNIAKQSEEQQTLPPDSPASAAGIKPASKASFYRKHAEEVEARLAATQRELADLRHMAEVEEAEAQEEARLESDGPRPRSGICGRRRRRSRAQWARHRPS